MRKYIAKVRRGACFSAISDRRGVSAVEFALVIPVLALFAVGVFDGGMAIKTGMDVSNAARAGGEYAAIHGWNDTAIKAAASSATSMSVTTNNTQYCGCASASGVTVQTCATTCASGRTAGAYISVTSSASYTPIFPAFWSSFLSNGSWQFSATSVTRTS